MWELLNLLDDLDAFEPTLLAYAATSAPGSLVIDLRLDAAEAVHSRWTLRCEEVVEHRLRLGKQCELDVRREHVLLLDHTERRADLYFSGPPTDPVAMFGALAAAHREVMGAWRPMHRYLNPLLSPEMLLALRDGLVASGPAPLMASYGAALESIGVNTTVLDAGPATYWLDSPLRRVETPHDVAVLILSDARVRVYGEPSLEDMDAARCFVVAREFTAATVPVT
jgi:hypothetical protein